MSQMNDNEFKTLDKISTDDSNITVEEILQLITEISRSEKSFELLIKNYSSSSSSKLLDALSFLLAQKAKERKLNSLELIIIFLENLQSTNNDGTFVNTISAIYYLFLTMETIKMSNNSQNHLYSFVINCLTFSGSHQSLVHNAIIDLLGLLCDRNLLNQVIKADQIILVKSILDDVIANSTDEGLNKEISELLTFPFWKESEKNPTKLSKPI